MKLYEIRSDIENCVRVDEESEDLVNTETGEVFDKEAFEKLQGEFNDKVLDLAKWIKNLDAERQAVYNEKQKLEKRKKTLDNKIESIRSYIDFCTLNIPKEKLPKDATTVITRSKSSSVEVDLDELMKFDNCDDYLTYAPPKPDKAEIKKAIKSGQTIPGCSIVEKQNLQIK